MGVPADQRLDWDAELKLAKQRATVLRRQKPHEVTVEVWLSTYLLLFPNNRTEKTFRVNVQALGPFRRKYGHLKMMDVTPMHAQAWILKYPGQLRYLKHAWRRAVLMQIAPMNIWNVVELPLRTKPRVRPPSTDELAAMLTRCHTLAQENVWWERFVDMIQVAAYSGARMGGLRTLERESVDRERRRMVVTEKGVKTRTLVLGGPAWPAIQRALDSPWPWCECTVSLLDGGSCAACGLPRRRRAQWESRRLVFRAKDGTPLTNDRIQRAWREVRGDFPFGFHSLKHFAATWLREQGVDPLDVAVQLGHMDSQGRPYEYLVKRVYDHPDPELALARIARIVDPQRVPLESEARNDD